MSRPAGVSTAAGHGGMTKSSSLSPAAFLKWAKQHEIFVHPDVDVLHSTPDMGGVGVFARKTLPPGTVVLSTPCTAAISPYSETHPRLPSVAVLQAASVPVTSTSKNVNLLPLARHDPVLLVVLRLMAEYCKGKSSMFLPWLQHCPNMRVHLFDLTPEEKKVLGLSDWNETEEKMDEMMQWSRWTGVSQQLRELKVEERWSMAQQDILASHPDIWPPQKATFGLFCRCMAHVFSRNFHREEIVGREGPYLLPGLDFLNHIDPPNTKFEVRGGGRKHGTTFTVVTSESVQAGTQVFATYGSIGSSRFAVEFQFLSDDVITRDLCRFSYEQLVEMAVCLLLVSETTNDDVKAKTTFSLWYKEVSRRVELLQRLGLLYDEGLYLKGNGYFEKGSTPGCEGSDSPLPVPSAGRSDVAPCSMWSVEEQGKEWHRFRAVVFLLLLPTTENFDEYYHRDASAHWEAPKTAAATKNIRAFLQLKLDAVRKTWWAVERAFGVGNGGLSSAPNADASQKMVMPCAAANTTEDRSSQPSLTALRMDLLRRTLSSEQGVLLEHLEMVPAGEGKR